jgi:hypothetical protein
MLSFIVKFACYRTEYLKDLKPKAEPDLSLRQLDIQIKSAFVLDF